MFSLPSLFRSKPERKNSSVNLEPVTREYLTSVEFLELIESDPERIESSTFVAPRLGDMHFGYFEVEYRDPVYK